MIPEILDRHLPSDTDSELALLAACLLDPTNVDRLGDQVFPADFYDSENGRLFDAIQTLHDAGKPICDMAVLVSELKQSGLYESIGGAAFIGKLFVDGKAQAPHAGFYASSVKRTARLRRQLDVAAELTRLAYDPKADPACITQWLDARLSGLDQRASDSGRTIGDIAAEVIADLKRPDARADNIFAGLPGYDETHGGWLPGELVILAARPKIGKTALAMQIAMYQATGNRPTLFISLEMEDRELVTRILCGSAKVNSRKVRTRRLDGTHIRALEAVAADMKGLPLKIEDPPQATLQKIRALAKAKKAANGLDLLVVDHLSLVRPSDPRRPRHEQVAEVSGGLKSLAKELGVVVLCLSQLNRECEGEVPRLHNLRESGAVEQDADVVLFLHRNRLPLDEKGNPQDTTTTKLITAAHRNGQEGEMELVWVPDETRFDEPARF